ncbi:MAG: type I 3-dehydroquinate dehydratase [Youngiibacter sp.]|nr:type I 3-dehydroquinate dehydratase [Youngiibacter sp.]
MVDVKGIRIGTGKPKICVPIVSRDAEGIIESARLIAMSQADLAEWRADLFEGHGDTDKVMEVLRSLRNALGDKPLMFTLRSAQEGGGSNLSGEQAARLLVNAAASGNTDLLDIEMFSYGGLLRMAVDSAKGRGVSVVGSYHDFHKTPDKSEIISRLAEIHASGADISKIAVMPNSKRDVLNLLDAALTINEKNPEITLVCISMSGIGALSRLTGEFFGSSLTFAAIGEGSAPGQIGIESLATVQDVLHSSLE